MKTIIFYGKRNTGMALLPFLVASGYKVKVMSGDADVEWMAHSLKLETVELERMGEFDLFICCHGTRIIPKEYLDKGVFINIHPCLQKYPGKNPIQKYVDNKDTVGTVESHYMVEQVDAGKKICCFGFYTGEVKTPQEFYAIAMPHYFKCLSQTLKEIGL